MPNIEFKTECERNDCSMDATYIVACGDTKEVWDWFSSCENHVGSLVQHLVNQGDYTMVTTFTYATNLDDIMKLFEVRNA